MDESPVKDADGSGPSEYSRDLVDSIVVAIPAWVTEVMSSRLGRTGEVDPGRFTSEIDRVGRAMAQRSRESLEKLFEIDVEFQPVNPLQLLRREASIVSETLHDLGAVPSPRDALDMAFHPDDVFGIGPLTWRDLGEDVHERGIAWGAWKAAVIISRHKGEFGTTP